MTGFDWTVLAIYLAGMIGLSVFLGRGQESGDDYYVGGRNLPWWAVGISTMATQTSANSFLGIPAFVALTDGGGLTWLQYELAVPLAMIVVMVFLIPFFRELQLVSVYEYLERRFGVGTRKMLSAVFLISRGLATGIGVYAIAVVLTVILEMPVWITILLIGAVTIVYDTIGGMAAVVYSDVIQLFVLLGGVILLTGYALAEAGGLGACLEAIEPARMAGVDWSTGFTIPGEAEPKAPFWAFMFGGLCLYASYYGVDQSQAQRELSAPTLDDTKRSLVLNGLARFPLTLLYLGLGLAAAGLYHTSPELQAAVAGSAELPGLEDKWRNTLVPHLILELLPGGLRAVLIAALLAAAMSSLDSALNSISAATMQDFVKDWVQPQAKQELFLSKLTTVLWGLVIMACALLGSVIEGSTVVESINLIGSAFYGPLLAAFLVGILSRRATGTGVITGVVAGVGANIGLYVLGMEGVDVVKINWMWWNLSGLIVSSVVTLGVSRLTPPPTPEQLDGHVLDLAGMAERERPWLTTYALLIGYFFLILLIAASIHGLHGTLTG